jgi:hypothetical protein
MSIPLMSMMGNLYKNFVETLVQMEEDRQRYPNIDERALCKPICSPQLLLVSAYIHDENSIANEVLFDGLWGPATGTLHD